MTAPAELAPALRAELGSGRPFLYHWELGGGLVAPIAHPDLALAQDTVRELLEAPVRAALERAAAAGRPVRALDLACNEGWWSHRLLEWGADAVVALDARPEHVARATALRDHLGVGADRLDLRVGDATVLNPGALGAPFDVVLHLGLLYHLEDPIGALRAVRGVLRDGGLIAVETQVTRQEAPIAHAWGSHDNASERAEASFAVRWERDDDFPLASVGGVVSLIPNRAALVLSLQAAGCTDVTLATPAPHHVSGFRSGDRVVATATAASAQTGASGAG